MGGFCRSWCFTFKTMMRFLVRLIIVLTSLYMMVSYIVSHYFGLDIIGDWYVLMYDILIVYFCFSERKFHCKYMKFLSLSNLLCDLAMRFDKYTSIINLDAHDFVPFGILAYGTILCFAMALFHFTSKNYDNNGDEKRNDNHQEDGNSTT